MEYSELPKLCKQHQAFANNLINGMKPKKAYEDVYDCSNMKPHTISVEAQKLKNNPKIKAYLEYAERNTNEVIKKKWEFDKDQAMERYDSVYKMALEKVGTKDGVQALNTMIKATDGMVKVSGCAEEKEETNINVGVQVPSIKLNGKDVEFIIGENE